MKPTPREQRPHIYVSFGKLATVLLGILVLIIYLTSHFTADYFLALIIICIIVSSIGLIVPYFISISEIQGSKLADIVYHGVAGLAILIASSVYIDDVITLSNEVKEAFNVHPIIKYLNVELEVNNGEAIAAGALGIFLSFLYAFVALIISKKA